MEKAARLAAQLRAEAALAAGLARAGGGTELAAALGLTTPASASTDVLLVTGGAPGAALAFAQLADAGSVRLRLALVARWIVPRRSAIRDTPALAATGGTGLALASVARWRRLAHDAPAGLAAWHKARRAARP